MMKNRVASRIISWTVALVLLGWSAAAGAEQLRMTGGWLQQRGTVNIPLWVVQLGPLNKSLLGLDDPTIPGSGFVNAVPQGTNPNLSPAQITIPAEVFQLKTSRPAPLQFALSQAFGAGNGGNVIQVTTMFSFNGPGNPAVMKATGTTLRLAPNFAYCPGAANNPNCTTNIAIGDDGTKAGRVTYTAGPNRFGGTMGMVITGAATGGGEVANSLGGTPLRIRHDGILGGGSQEVGLYYANTSSVVLTGAAITTGAVINPTTGLITQPGVQTGTGTADINVNTGFPWTTGQVIASEPGGVTSMDISERITMTGSDNRTANGRGTLSLVAGGISHRLTSGQTFISVDKVTFDIASGQLTPALSPTGVAAIASLLLIGGGYALRKRF